MRKHWGFLAVVLAVAGCAKPYDPPMGQPPGSASVTTSMSARFGDGAPHEAENRGALQPKDLSADAERELTLAGNAIRPGLQRQRAAGDYRPETTIAVLTAAGHPRSTVFARSLTGGPGVVFGVSTADGCLVGSVRPDRVQVEPRGAIAEWGCDTPVTH